MKSYINYVKRQNKQIRDMHIIFWSGILTIIFALIYLQLAYDIFTPSYKRIEVTDRMNEDQFYNDLTKLSKASSSMPMGTSTANMMMYSPIDYLKDILENSKKIWDGKDIEYHR